MIGIEHPEDHDDREAHRAEIPAARVEGQGEHRAQAVISRVLMVADVPSTPSMNLARPVIVQLDQADEFFHGVRRHLRSGCLLGDRSGQTLP